ncbi:hypothetical protein LCGC14_0734970 [marine sediment metagenome]|uniref:Portal protein n=1 Tax=marine sediment metagenome TaxID=412755 RepID=A0A0F9QTH1_9ZZZZ
MTLKNASDAELWKLRDEIKKDFITRDTLWDNRREIRYRRMGPALEALPLNSRVKDTALMVYQTEMPNQEAHKRTKRLIANKPQYEVILLRSGGGLQTLAQELENGVKALGKWMSRGNPTFDWKLTQHQQGDGLGIIRVDFLPDHGQSLKDFDLDDIIAGDEDESIEGAAERNKARAAFRTARTKTENDGDAFKVVTDDALRAEFPPFRLIAVDPLNCYWHEDDDGIAVMVETGEKALNPLLEAFSDYGLRFDKDTGKIFIDEETTEAVGSRTYPALDTGSSRFSTTSNVSASVSYTEVRTRDNIFIMIEHPKLRKGSRRRGGRGVVFSFPNPFGPYTTGYALVPGDVTTDDDPAYKYQPVIEGVLSTAQALNVLMTARLSASIEEALAPAYVKVSSDQPMLPPDEEKTPEIGQENRAIPTIAGEIKRVETPNADIDKAEARLLSETELYQMAEAQEGGASSETSGHRLAIQVAQADIQMVPYQNVRARALEAIMKGIIYAIRKHGLPVYIPALPDGGRKGDKVRVAEPAKITPEMGDLPFDILVSLGAETPITKYAKWQALAQRMEQGTASYQTVVEQSDVEDPEEEIARVMEGRVLIQTMEQLTPMLVELALAAGKRRIDEMVNPEPESAPGAGDQLPLDLGIDPATGLAGGGGAPGQPQDQVRLPGLNMPVVQGTSDFGPRSPEGVEVLPRG